MTGAVSVRGLGAPSNSAVTYRVGGREYPLKTNRQCKVCMSPFRFDIEEALIGGRTYRKIVEALPEGEHELVPENVKNHYLNGHLPTAQSAHRQIIEARASRVGKAVDDSVEQLVDGVTLAQVVVQKSFEAIAEGRMAPDMKDALSAAKFLADLGEYDEGGTDMLAVSEAFMAYHDTAAELMTPEMFEAFGRMLASNPVLKALAAKYEGQEVEQAPEPQRAQGEVLSYSDERVAKPVAEDHFEEFGLKEALVDIEQASLFDDPVEPEPVEDLDPQMALFEMEMPEDDDEGWEEAPEED
jgi:hypothetical protein